MSEYRALCEFCGLAPFENHKNQLCITAKGIKARGDYNEGWDRGYDSPYYPKEREEQVLANIEKVSPAFVRWYRRGKSTADSEDFASQHDFDNWDGF